MGKAKPDDNGFVYIKDIRGELAEHAGIKENTLVCGFKKVSDFEGLTKIGRSWAIKKDDLSEFRDYVSSKFPGRRGPRSRELPREESEPELYELKSIMEILEIRDTYEKMDFSEHPDFDISRTRVDDGFYISERNLVEDVRIPPEYIDENRNMIGEPFIDDEEIYYDFRRSRILVYKWWSERNAWLDDYEEKKTAAQQELRDRIKEAGLEIPGEWEGGVLDDISWMYEIDYDEEE